MIINFQDENQIAVTFNAKAEELLTTVGYDQMNQDDKNSLVFILANKKGGLFSDITDDYVLNYHKNLKIDTLNQTCDDTICAGFTSTTNNHIYRTNRDDQINMIGQKDELAYDSTITTVMWKTEDVGYISHTRDEWMSIYSEAFNYKRTQLNHYNDLKQKVLSATTHADIIAITW